MIDYKEKYEQAIERLKQWDREHPNGYVISERDEFIFPELAESEDEMIRKYILSHFQEHLNKVQEFISKGMTSPFSGEEIKMLEASVVWLKKQGQQKPVWSEEDEINLEKAIWYVKNPAPKVVKDSMLVEWLKSLKDRVGPKQEWSKQDETLLNCCLGAINTTDYFDKDNKDKMSNWLMKFKDRVQLQSLTITDEELVQAKKDAYNDALDKIEYHSGEPTFDDGWSAAIWYLKKRNTMPQSQWKPSDEQFAALLTAIGDEKKTGSDVAKVLRELYYDLKKLREE